jgi:antitoxin component YwqK of YwqJK toxin-antitoxin module
MMKPTIVWLVAIVCWCRAGGATTNDGTVIAPPSSYEAFARTNLTERDGLIYVRNSDQLYSGALLILSTNGVKSNEIAFKDGKRDGPQRLWLPDGTLLFDENYKAGERHGWCATYYKNGQIWREETFREGKRHGLQLSWHPNGQMESKAEYKDGERHGILAIWYDNGQEDVIDHYDKGRSVGPFQKWNRDGTELK